MEIKDAQVENYDEILFRMNRYLQCNFMTGGQGQMNIMIASDIHGSAYYCSKLMEAFEREGADRLLLLGDVLHMLNEKKQKIFCVRGNCDTEVDQMVLEFPILADYAILEAETRLIYATHGHVFHLQHLPMLQPGDLLLHGHTHIPAWKRFGENNLYVNPGSVSIPKEGSPHGYMMLTDKNMGWKTLTGEVYHMESI